MTFRIDAQIRLSDGERTAWVHLDHELSDVGLPPCQQAGFLVQDFVRTALETRETWAAPQRPLPALATAARKYPLLTSYVMICIVVASAFFLSGLLHVAGGLLP